MFAMMAKYNAKFRARLFIAIITMSWVSELLRFIAVFLEEGDTQEIYRSRHELLVKICRLLQARDPKLYDCGESMEKFLTQAVSSIFPAVNVYTTSECRCFPDSQEKKLGYFEFRGLFKQRDIRELPDEISKHVYLDEEIKCTKCKSGIRRKRCVRSDMFMINLDFVRLVDFGDIPKGVFWGNEWYTLQGFTSRIFMGKLSHIVTCYPEENGEWRLYDDTRSISSKLPRQVMPVVVVYGKEPFNVLFT